MFQIQEVFSDNNGFPFNPEKAQRSAREAFDLMHSFKWTPPGQGLRFMGTPFVMERHVAEAFQNCAFVSTTDIDTELSDSFEWLMHMSMCGVGVGFDTMGAGKITIRKPRPDHNEWNMIPDTREGWAKAWAILLDSYFNPGRYTQTFNFSKIRPKGTPIKGMGGTASGPEPLKLLFEQTRQILNDAAGKSITSRVITDLMNLAGVCVVSGNVRRSAEIAFGSPSDDEYINLKNYALNPERASYGWVSNNSVYADGVEDYSQLAEATWNNGEPGYAWMNNVHRFGRMNGITDTQDWSAIGFNPCGEQPLEHKEMCTLVEIFLPNIHSKQEFRRVIKFAYLYAKTVSLANEWVSDPVNRKVMMDNRRIGLSLTGITQFLGAQGMDTLNDWMDHGYHWSGDYDRIYSAWMGIPTSIRRTSVKPSGTVSLLAGVTPGIHYNVADRFHIRRVNLPVDHPLVDSVAAAGVSVVPNVVDSRSVVAEFPVDAGVGMVSERDVDPRDFLNLVGTVAKRWADNAVSATVKFDQEKVSPADLEEMLVWSSTHLKDISFLPQDNHGYEQAPYESISETQYQEMRDKMTTIKFNRSHDAHDIDDVMCDGDSCEV